MSRLVLVPRPGELPPVSDVGGKAHNMARLAAVPGVRVPPWCVVTTAAFDAFVVPLRDAGSPGADAVRARLDELALPEALEAELRAAIADAHLAGDLLAVRSSATVEDAAGASFAGQFTSVLGVPVTVELDPLWDAIRCVWRSAYGAHALAYAQGAAGATPVRMAVLIQSLAPARAAGVAFSLDPVTGDRDVAVVSAVYGLGELLVSGDADADTIRVRFAGDDVEAIDTTIAEKHHALVRIAGVAGGTRPEVVAPDVAATAAVSDAQAVAIARVARRLEQVLGGPQDVEWTLGPADGDAAIVGPQEDDQLYVVQTRPVTAAGAMRAGERRIWDNSNIVESYSGVTTPLTFSFARGVYEQVYRQFCDVLGVSGSAIEAHRGVFASMLGLMRGRVYYNLLNWYRVLALLPGYALNREFMERMMGVRERLADPPPPPGAGARSRDALRLLHTSWRLWREHRRLDAEVAAFFARVNEALAPVDGANLDTWSADDLVALYRRLDRELLVHWRAPLVNDFFAMIWFGTLGRLVAKWLPEAEPTLVNDLLVGEGGIISTEPARRVMALAALAAGDDVLRAAFAGEPDDAALLRHVRTEPRHAAFARELDAYLAKFGDRCIGELKLETVTPSEDPAFVIRMTRAYVAQHQTDALRGTSHEAEVRARAESHVRSRLRGARRAAFFMVVRHARARIRDRENLRFERTRVFGAVRRIFRGLGLRLHELGRIAEPRDVFYLTAEEVFAAVDGTGMTHELRDIATFRRRQFARYEQEPPPPERFETWGPPDVRPAAAAGTGAATAGDLTGLGCCPGVVRAPVRLVRDPSAAGNLHGHILVAERTDPGWTLLFPTASGLLVQRGSLLSHSAIVAREIGLPCVVGIPGLMDSLRDGEWVEMDGATGLVRRIDDPPHPIVSA